MSSASFEVVGNGRIASLFLRQAGSVPVPRGKTLGTMTTTTTRTAQTQTCSSSTENEATPIIVATPSKAWTELYHQCIPARRSDLVWMGNGLPQQLQLFKSENNNNNDATETSHRLEEMTWVVPHFGVLQINGPIVSSEISPPTYVCGTHASFVQEILQNEGLANVQHVDFSELQVHAVRKLLWASCIWLVCHSEDPPLTVTQVHEQKSALLEQLVRELLPVAKSLSELSSPYSNNSLSDGGEGSLSAILEYMEKYSRSMPQAIPSRSLALAELSDRNGVFYRPGGQQPCHRQLLIHQRSNCNNLGEEILALDNLLSEG